MATFTVTTDVNADTLSVKAGADTYNINGLNARVTFDGDTRYDLNGNTSAAIGTITPSASLGGSVTFDGTGSWLIPFNTGSGTIPATGTTISKGGASGKLVGVYTALTAAPSAAGGAMPASGYIKVKQWNGTLYGTGALTGLTANSIAGEKYGWVEIVAVDSSSMSLNRINQLFGGTTAVQLFKGAWYNIGTTDGNRATAYQIPSNGVNQYHAGVFVDNATPISITSASWSGGTATFSVTAHGAVTGQTVIIDGCTPLAWNVTGQITKVDANTFTMAIASDPGAMTVNGTSSIPEFYPMTDGSALSTVVATDSLRGKWCWIDTSGNLRFGNDGTNNTGGYVPPSGRVIRIGNIFFTGCTSATKTQNAVNSTYASRYFIRNDTGAGSISIDKCSFLLRSNVMGIGPTTFTNTGFATAVGVSGPVNGTFNMLNCGVGQIASSATTACALANITGGSNILDCVFGLGSTAKVGLSLATCYSPTIKRVKCIGTGDATASAALSMNIGRDATISDIIWSGGPATLQQWIGTNTVSNMTFYSSAYDKGSPSTAQPIISVINQCTGWTFDNFSTGGLVGQGIRGAMINIANNSNNLTFKNFGTADSPLDFRDSNGYTSATWTRSGTVCTVTKTAHGLKAGDWIYAIWSSDTSAVVVGLKNTGFTIVDANTFSFTCLNAGATSGTLGYEFTAISAIISNAGDNCTFQNIHALGHQSSSWGTSSNNTFSNIRFENMTGDTKLSDASTAGTNAVIDSGVFNNHLPTTGIVNSNGTDFVSQYLTPYNTSYSSAGVSWARSAAVITVTKTAHGMVTGDRIYVKNSSDTSATSWGFKAITVNGADTFTYTGVSAGGTSGTLDFYVPDGRFALTFNEGTSTNTHYTVDSGTDILFTGPGGLSMPTVNDQITYTMPRFTKGFDTFATIIPEMGGGTITNYDITYDIDTGSGFSGSFKNASYPRAGGSGSAAATTFTVTDATGVSVNDYVYGQGIAYSAKVTNVNTGTNTITVNNANTGTVSGIIQFSALPNEGTLASSGIKLKIRIKTTTTNTSAITFLGFYAQSTNTSRLRLYDQSVFYTLTLSGLVSGSDVSIRTAGVTGSNLVNVDANAGTTYGYLYPYSAGTSIDFVVYKTGYKPFEVKGYTLLAENTTYPVQQILDPEYS